VLLAALPKRLIKLDQARRIFEFEKQPASRRMMTHPFCFQLLSLTAGSRGRPRYRDLNRHHKRGYTDRRRRVLPPEYCQRLRRHAHHKKGSQDKDEQERSVVAQDRKVAAQVDPGHSPHDQQRPRSA
jgi:hypothetical protein